MSVILLVVLTTSNAAATVEFTVMHGVGGVSDITSRYIANNLKNQYPIINRPGGGGVIAINHLLKNNTMMLATMVQIFVTNPINFKDSEYISLNDIEVLATVGVMPSALVCHKNTKFTSFSEFVESKKIISFGFGGYGSSEHIATELLVKETEINSTMIPYAQGGNKALSDLIGGHIDCMFGNYPTMKSQISNKNLVILMTSHDLGYDVSTWNSIYKKQFPFQSYLSIIVPTSMDYVTKHQILDDLKNSFLQDHYKTELIKIGLFPVLETNKDKIKDIIKYMKFIQKFILEKNIKTAG